jgi:hypothetical protein
MAAVTAASSTAMLLRGIGPGSLAIAFDYMGRILKIEGCPGPAERVGPDRGNAWGGGRSSKSRRPSPIMGRT